MRGGLYDSGQGVPLDFSKAAAWYRKAAFQGLAAAENDLGRLYDSGHGVPQHHSMAAAWYRKAAVQGYAAAEDNLGELYVLGRGVPQDEVSAYKWLALARASAKPTATWYAGLSARIAALAAKMTPAQIAQAQAQARAILKTR